MVSMQFSQSVLDVMPNLCSLFYLRSLFYFCEPLNIESRCISMSRFVVRDRAEASKTMETRAGLHRVPKTAEQREEIFVERAEILLALLAYILPDSERG